LIQRLAIASRCCASRTRLPQRIKVTLFIRTLICDKGTETSDALLEEELQLHVKGGPVRDLKQCRAKSAKTRGRWIMRRVLAMRWDCQKVMHQYADWFAPVVGIVKQSDECMCAHRSFNTQIIYDLNSARGRSPRIYQDGVMAEMARYPDLFRQRLLHAGQHYLDERMSRRFSFVILNCTADLYLGVGSVTRSKQLRVMVCI